MTSESEDTPSRRMRSRIAARHWAMIKGGLAKCHEMLLYNLNSAPKDLRICGSHRLALFSTYKKILLLRKVITLFSFSFK